MKTNKRQVQLDEAIFGTIGVLMVVAFLGFLALDIGAVPLGVITVIVLGMAVTDLVQTARGGGTGNGNS
jgi:hypothetical protein